MADQPPDRAGHVDVAHTGLRIDLRGGAPDDPFDDLQPGAAQVEGLADQTEFVGATRVTDLDVDGDSNIYIASWKGATFTYAGEDVGYLVRVTPKGYKSPAMPNFAKASDAELVKLLESPSHRRRLEAQRRLIERNLDQDTTRSLIALASEGIATLLAAQRTILQQQPGFE